MEGPLHIVIWFGWAFACAFCARLGFTRLFRSRLGSMAQFAACGMWLVLLLMGWVVASFSGMQMYGFDASDPRQMLGYWVFFYSPMGLPIVFGAPAVLVVDLVRAVIDRRITRQITGVR